MGYQNKTTETETSVTDFINSYVESEQKRDDSFQLVEMMTLWSGFHPKMWGPTIVGFGSYHYRYESGHEGDMPLLGFSPRKAALSLYVYSPIDDHKQLLENLGKYKIGKACIYIKKLSDINVAVLEKMCKATIEYLNEHHECACREQ